MQAEAPNIFVRAGADRRGFAGIDNGSPPTASTKSTCSALASWMAFLTKETLGFGSTPPSSTNAIPVPGKKRFGRTNRF